MLIAITANSSWNLVHFRAALISALQAKGHVVMAVAPEDQYTETLISMGCIYRSVSMHARSMNIVQESFSLFRFVVLFKLSRPGLVLNFTIKPVIYGSLATRLLGIPTINTITGLGSVFIKKGASSRLVEHLYRLAHRRVEKVFFQNADDFSLMVEKKSLIKRSQADMIPGSGIDMSRFPLSPLNKRSPFVFLMIGRLLWEKGVQEYATAAEQIQSERRDCCFQLAGRLDERQLNSVDPIALQLWQDAGVISYIGYTENIDQLIRGADCVVLPSYREGLPMALLEACAMGRVVIASDVPGCRSVAIDGKNGFLCKPRSAKSLTSAMKRVLQLPPERLIEMGRTGRDLVEKKFSKEIVVDRYLKTINTLINE
jgi:glycosyltransferase involved in cell wall biosynthesis